MAKDDNEIVVVLSAVAIEIRHAELIHKKIEAAERI